MRRLLAGAALAAGVAAAVASDQVAVARWARVLVPDQSYTAGNDTWPFQLVLLCWCAASAAALGAVAARRVSGCSRWRYVTAAAAAAGALVPVHTVAGWAASAEGVSGDPLAGAYGAMLSGALIGGASAVAVLAWRAAARAAMVWVALVWSTAAAEVLAYQPPPSRGRDHVVPVDPLGIFTPFPQSNELLLLCLVVPVALTGMLGWWAGRHQDRAAALAALYGPLVLVAVHTVVGFLPGGRDDGDHYSREGDLGVWLVVALLGAGAAAAGAAIGRARRADRPHATARDDAPTGGGPRRTETVTGLLAVAGSMLATAAYLDLETDAGWLEAGVAGAVLGTALAHRRGRVPDVGAGAGWAVAGMLGLAAAATAFDLWGRQPSPLWWMALPAVVVAIVIGALARGARPVSWAVIAIGGLRLGPLLLGPLVSGPAVSGSLLVSGPFLLLSVAAAVAVVALTRDHGTRVPSPLRRTDAASR